MLWLSLIVLLPIAAIVVTSFEDGLGTLLGQRHRDGGAVHPAADGRCRRCSSRVVNAVFGTLIAWVLVRDRFPGQRAIEVIIDIPFALPTIVAGLVLISLYGPDGPFGVNLVGTRTGVVLALLFVTLPFVVRSVQPVLMAMERDVEEAAASLGASGFTTFRRIVLPTITPAVLGRRGARLRPRARASSGRSSSSRRNLIGKTEVVVRLHPQADRVRRPGGRRERRDAAARRRRRRPRAAGRPAALRGPPRRVTPNLTEVRSDGDPEPLAPADAAARRPGARGRRRRARPASAGCCGRSPSATCSALVALPVRHASCAARSRTASARCWTPCRRRTSCQRAPPHA